MRERVDIKIQLELSQKRKQQQKARKTQGAATVRTLRCSERKSCSKVLCKVLCLIPDLVKTCKCEEEFSTDFVLSYLHWFLFGRNALVHGHLQVLVMCSDWLQGLVFCKGNTLQKRNGW